MRSLPSALTILGLLVSTPALAGGIGVIGGGGIHSDRAYYYTQELEQGIDTQQRPNYAWGMEAALGDKDDRTQGLMRVYVNTDLPVNDPDTGDIEDPIFPPASAEPAQQSGVMMLGVQWGVLGDPDGIQLVLNSLLGSGFATKNNLEYLQAELGAGVTYAVTDSLVLTGSVAGAARFRKHFSSTENVYLGVRFMFD